MHKDLLRNLTIADKMGLFLVIVLGLMALMTFAYVADELTGQQEEFAARQAELVTSHIAAAAGRAAGRGAEAWRAELQAVLEQEYAGQAVSYLRVSADGVRPVTVGTLRAGDHTSVRSIAGPGGATAYLAIALDAGDFARRLALLRRNLFYGALLVVSLGVLLISLLIIHLLQPLLRLAQNVQRIQGGDLSTRCPVERRDEVGRLAEAFNELMGNLQEKEDTMLAAYDALAANFAQLEGIVEALPCAIVGGDAQGAVSVVNEAFLRLLRSERDTVMGEPLAEVLQRLSPELAAFASSADSERELTVAGQRQRAQLLATEAGRVLLLAAREN